MNTTTHLLVPTQDIDETRYVIEHLDVPGLTFGPDYPEGDGFIVVVKGPVYLLHRVAKALDLDTDQWFGNDADVELALNRLDAEAHRN